MKRKQTLRGLKKKAWKILSEYVRRKDADEGGTTQCYTCGRYLHWKYEAQAGHAIPGRHNAVLLDESLCRPQCLKCNFKGYGFGSGMHHVFTAKLIKENGMEWWDKKEAESRSVVKLTHADVEDFILEYQSKLAALDLKRAA